MDITLDEGEDHRTNRTRSSGGEYPLFFFQIKVKVLPHGVTVTYRVGLGLHSNKGEGNILMRIVCLYSSIVCSNKL